MLAMLAGFGCDGKSPSSTELGDSSGDESVSEAPEELVECQGAEYPASEVLLIAPEPAVAFLDGPAALAQLDGFRCISDGLVQISGVTDLGPLASLERVGMLYLVDNPGLTDLDALSSLTHVGSLVVDGNPDLVDVSGIAGLESVLFLTLGHEDFDGPSSDHGNDALTQLPGFPELLEVEAIVIGDNDALTDLGPPPAVDLFGVSVWNSPALPFAQAEAWAQAMASDSTYVRICGCLDDPNPVCTPDPLPP